MGMLMAMTMLEEEKKRKSQPKAESLEIEKTVEKDTEKKLRRKKGNNDTTRED